jgi:hypothetical protein
LYFALPRHTFGEVQRVLFPRYFTINACLSLTTLLIFVKHHPAHTWDTEIAIQVCTQSKNVLHPERRSLLVAQCCPLLCLERYLIWFNPTSFTRDSISLKILKQTLLNFSCARVGVMLMIDIARHIRYIRDIINVRSRLMKLCRSESQLFSEP